MEKPCCPDLTDEKQVIRYIRDLLNLSNLLEHGFDEEFTRLIKILKELGWSSDWITRMLTYASTNTRYEYLVDYFGKRIVPRPLPERGDQREWRRIKSRAK